MIYHRVEAIIRFLLFSVLGEMVSKLDRILLNLMKFVLGLIIAKIGLVCIRVLS